VILVSESIVCADNSNEFHPSFPLHHFLMSRGRERMFFGNAERCYKSLLCMQMKLIGNHIILPVAAPVQEAPNIASS
jgi:hypothetical protein